MRWGLVMSVLCCAFALAHAADVYSWRDANGVRHFGEKPPENAVDIKKHAIDNAPPAEPQPPRDHVNDSQRLLRAFDEERAERNQQKAQQKAEQQKRDQQCAQIKKEWENFQISSRRIVKDKNGQIRELNDAEDKEYERKLREALAHCQ